MAKKGGPQALQTEVGTDEEFHHLLERQGLIVIDVYSDWCGPCLAMVGNLKKVKLELGSDFLHYAVAKADTIEALERFRNHSEPTWLFVAGGMLLKVVFGADAPRLSDTIVRELERELKVMEGQLTRGGVPLTERTEQELEKDRLNEERAQREREKEEREMAQRREKAHRVNLERLARGTVHLSLILYFPQLLVEPEEPGGRRTCPAAYKTMTQCNSLGISLYDQLEVELTPEILQEVLYDSELELPDWFLEGVWGRQALASIIVDKSLQGLPPTDSQLELMEEPPPPPPPPEALLGEIEEKVHGLLFGYPDQPQDKEELVGYQFMVENEEAGMGLSGIWTPRTYLSKSAAIRALFANIVQNLGIKEESLPPPSYVMIFEGSKAHEVLDSSEQFAEDVIDIGFFDGMEPGVAKRVARTVHQLERKGQQVVQDSKMVVALKRTRSDPMMALAQLGPVYISSDVKSGTREVELFFPPTIEVEDEVDPWGPPPPLTPPSVEGGYYDDEGNIWVETLVQTEEGDLRMVKRMYKRADGTHVRWSEDEEEGEKEGGGEGEGEEGAAKEEGSALEMEGMEEFVEE